MPTPTPSNPPAAASFPAGRRVLRVAEVAVRWAVSQEQVLNLIESGSLQAINISAGRERAHWRVPVEALLHFEKTESNLFDPASDAVLPARPVASKKGRR